MMKSTRAALAIGLVLVGVAGLVGRSVGQDGVRQASNTTAGAQAATAKPAGPAVIGTIDMDSVLKNYDKFKVSMETTQAEALARHNDLMKIANEGQAEAQKLQAITPGSIDEKKIQDKITQLKAQLQAGKEQAQAEFSRKDAELLAMMYNEIQQMTAAVAKQRNMNFVVKYSSAPPSGSDPKSIEAALFRSVVYADPKVDLTGDVTKWLNHYYKQAGGPAPKGTTTPAPAAGAPATATAPTTTAPR